MYNEIECHTGEILYSGVGTALNHDHSRPKAQFWGSNWMCEWSRWSKSNAIEGGLNVVR